MTKRIIIFLIIICVATNVFPLEFRLEYEGLPVPQISASKPFFLVSDKQLAYIRTYYLESSLHILDYQTNTTRKINLELIQDFYHLENINPINENNKFLIEYTDTIGDIHKVIFDASSENYINNVTDNYSSNTCSTIGVFPVPLSVSIFKNYHLRGYSYSNKTIDEAWWIEEGFYKIALIQSNNIIQTGYIEKAINDSNEEYFQIFKDRDGNEIIFPEFHTKILFDQGRNRLMVLVNFEMNPLTSEPTFDKQTLYIYKLIYDATCNDTRVRIREEPNLSCSTLGYLNAGDAVKVTDKSDEPFEIDGESWYWYKVESDSLPDGWVYGKYLDIEE